MYDVLGIDDSEGRQVRLSGQQDYDRALEAAEVLTATSIDNDSSWRWCVKLGKIVVATFEQWREPITGQLVVKKTVIVS